MQKIQIYLNGQDQQSNFSVQFASSCEIDGVQETKEKSVFVADGGLNLLLKNQVDFDQMFWAGDWDSLNAESHEFLKKSELSNHVQIKILQREKNHSDFSDLLDDIFQRYQNQSLCIDIFGGLGGRRDHEHANKEEAKRFVSMSPCPCICVFHGGVIIANCDIDISVEKGRVFSVFASQGNKVELSGCQYAGTHQLDRPSYGISNVALQDIVTIKTKGVISVYLE